MEERERLKISFTQQVVTQVITHLHVGNKYFAHLYVQPSKTRIEELQPKKYVYWNVGAGY